MAIHAPITGAPAGATPLPSPPFSIGDAMLRMCVAAEYVESLAAAVTYCLDSNRDTFRAGGIPENEATGTASSLVNLIGDQARVLLSLYDDFDRAGMTA